MAAQSAGHALLATRQVMDGQVACTHAASALTAPLPCSHRLPACCHALPRSRSTASRRLPACPTTRSGRSRRCAAGARCCALFACMPVMPCHACHACLSCLHAIMCLQVIVMPTGVHLMAAWVQVLGDHEWAAAFVEQNQRQLELSYDALTGGGCAMLCPDVQCCAMLCFVAASGLRAAEESWGPVLLPLSFTTTSPCLLCMLCPCCVLCSCAG